MSKKIKATDRVGTTINNLKIIDWKRENSRTYFFVECELCGNRKWLRSDGVINGNNQSCGCLREKTQFQQDNLSGKKFGRLTAIKPTEQRADNGSVIWYCECECGGHKHVSASDLVGGRVKSCGCIREELQTKLGNKLADITKQYSVEGTNVRNLTMKTRKDNTSGHTGVSWDSNKGKWIAQIKFKGRSYNLGGCVKKEDAIKAREDAKEAMFGNFLEWFSKEHPVQWEKMKKK